MAGDPADNFNLTLTKDAFKEPVQETMWIVEDLLEVGGISLWTAKPFVGKSTTARTCARRVSRGERFIGKKTTRVPVAYFALEERRSEIVAHFKKMGPTGDELLYIHTGSAPRENVTKKLREKIIEYGIKLAFIDPLVMLLIRGVKDLNDYTTVYAALEPLISIARDTGCHIALIHHMGKTDRDGQDQTMGSTAFAAAADTMVIMRIKEGRFRTLETQQRRAGSNLAPITLTLDLKTEVVDVGAPVRVVMEEAKLDVVLEFLRKNTDKQLTRDEIASALKGRRQSITTSLDRGVSKGEIAKTGSGKSGDPFKYQSTPGWEERKFKFSQGPATVSNINEARGNRA